MSDCITCRNPLGTGDNGYQCRACKDACRPKEYVLKSELVSELVKAQSEIIRLREIIIGMKCSCICITGISVACGKCQVCRAKQEMEGKV